jgi:hypothetical protein
MRFLPGLLGKMQKENAKALDGRFGCAFTPAFGRAEAPFGATFYSTRERVPFRVVQV